MNAEIRVQRSTEHGKAFTFVVSVSEGEESRTEHHVTLARSDYQRWAAAGESPEELVRRSFEFLLERESKESILARFDLSVIPDYFADFESAIGAP